MEAVKKSAKALYRSLPILLGVILLISLANVLIPKSAYTSLFRGKYFVDPFIGSIMGSILAGNPVTSYILGGELLTQGVSLIAVTAFLVAWVTVGLVQLPAEAMLLGKKFAIARNAASFVFVIIAAIITVSIFNLI
ncbi:hypothetical protein KY347_05580 [Candidatus Woesearchaeota archaeon]|nr:hypothetical protein [Candidatus Woesearchaeota archaeon]